MCIFMDQIVDIGSDVDDNDFGKQLPFYIWAPRTKKQQLLQMFMTLIVLLIRNNDDEEEDD